VSLAQMGLAASWMVVVILGREFAVTLLRAVAHARGQALPASPIGKLKMVAQVVAILALILGGRADNTLHALGTLALWGATIAALVSAADYYRHFNALLAVRAMPPRETRDPLAPPQEPRPEPAHKRVSA
jgi:CDP-diacylglycerol--glycerol-3-phosphate 3-phosphatidyltransferase